MSRTRLYGYGTAYSGSRSDDDQSRLKLCSQINE